ncbi:MAG TPA: hypothetical protein VFN43_02655 [Humibacillus sp.]|nr:hypothetical protein [Humibacillus sp.]
MPDRYGVSAGADRYCGSAGADLTGVAGVVARASDADRADVTGVADRADVTGVADLAARVDTVDTVDTAEMSDVAGGVADDVLAGGAERCRPW